MLRDAVASWLVCSTPELAVQVRALGGDMHSVVFLCVVLNSLPRYLECS